MLLLLLTMIVFIRENSRLAMLAAGWLGKPNAAIVIKNTIYLWGASRSEFLQNISWVRHEVAHVYQYKRYGLLLFLYLYVAESSRKGYYSNRFEKEARSFERDGKLLNNITFR